VIAGVHGSVLLITDRRQLSPDARTNRDEVVALERWLDEAPGCVDGIQIREPDLDAIVLCGLVKRVTARARDTSTVVIVNDRADVALAAAAGGVHLRGDGPPVERVRALTTRAWIIGRSIHRPDDALGPGRGADYLIFGSVFPSRSKPAAAVVSGVDELRLTVARTHVPVLAVGGLTPPRAAECRHAGAAGIAAIGLFLPPGRRSDAMGIRNATRALREAMAEPTATS
jgi:thiamine-phosphate pyrophosphorylase